MKFRFTFKNGNHIVNKFMSLTELLECDFAQESMITQINEDTLPMLGHITDEDYIEYDLIGESRFTGLKDKNGVCIYEGDVIKSVSELLRPFDNSVKTRTGEFVTKHKVIEYREDQSSFCFVGCPITGISQTQATKYFEVVGNIHETPELITHK